MKKILGPRSKIGMISATFWPLLTRLLLKKSRTGIYRSARNRSTNARMVCCIRTSARICAITPLIANFRRKMLCLTPLKRTWSTQRRGVNSRLVSAKTWTSRDLARSSWRCTTWTSSRVFSSCASLGLTARQRCLLTKMAWRRSQAPCTRQSNYRWPRRTEMSSRCAR